MKSRLSIFLILFVSVLQFSQQRAISQTYIEGNSYFGRNNYIEYVAGTLPLILSVPHGGYETPAEIPDRTCGTTVTDSYTLELANEISEEIFNLTGCYTHIIFNNLKRIKLDANRDVEEATCGDYEAEIAWGEYHKFIDSAKAAVIREYGKGLFIDLHGQSSHGERIELGYLITGSELALSDAVLNTETYINKSSIRNLAGSNVYSASFSELLRGAESLGTLLEESGYVTVPSMTNEYPTGDFYSGGYNTDRHGSKTGGSIDGIQIECNREIRFEEVKRLAFAGDLAEILLDYLKEHYFPNLEEYYCNGSAVQDVLISQFSYFPNPVTDYLRIDNIIATDIKIFNLVGELVYSVMASPQDEIYLGNIPDGVYVILFMHNGEIVNRGKIVKASNN